MTTNIIKIRNPLLKEFIQYFIFFSTDTSEVINYTTFPNDNLCMAIYKNNKVVHERNPVLNNCNIISGSQSFTSRLYGFHEIPFQVNIKAPIDQICILFKPSALSIFTNIPYKDLMGHDDVFNAVFPCCDKYFLEMLYNEQCLKRRADLLEQLLIINLNRSHLSTKMKEALYIIGSSPQQKTDVKQLSDKLGINQSTLYRLFIDNLGQSPKAYLKTLRFRRTLNEMLNGDINHLTKIAYTSDYFDQAHFIKDFKKLSGISPKQLINSIQVQQEELAWIYRKE